MMEHPVILLSIVTLLAVLAFALWQRQSVRASQARHGEKPGDVTMMRHDAPDPPDQRAASGGDVHSYKKHDSDADTARPVAGIKPTTVA